MMKWMSAVMMVLCLAVAGAPIASAVEETKVTQGDGKKKHKKAKKKAAKKAHKKHGKKKSE